MRTKVIVTKKGSEMRSNKWKEGQEIECSSVYAEIFIKRGIAVMPGDEPLKDENAKPKETKPKKK